MLYLLDLDTTDTNFISDNLFTSDKTCTNSSNYCGMDRNEWPFISEHKMILPFCVEF